MLIEAGLGNIQLFGRFPGIPAENFQQAFFRRLLALFVGLRDPHQSFHQDRGKFLNMLDLLFQGCLPVFPANVAAQPLAGLHKGAAQLIHQFIGGIHRFLGRILELDEGGNQADGYDIGALGHSSLWLAQPVGPPVHAGDGLNHGTTGLIELQRNPVGKADHLAGLFTIDSALFEPGEGDLHLHRLKITNSRPPGHHREEIDITQAHDALSQDILAHTQHRPGRWRQQVQSLDCDKDFFYVRITSIPHLFSQHGIADFALIFNFLECCIAEPGKGLL